MALRPSPRPLGLSLVPHAMNARRLRCLVVRHGTAFTTEIRDRDALVAAMQRQLCARITSAASADGLALFLARADDTNGWLNGSSDDVAALALAGDDAIDEDDGDEVTTRFLTARNWMDPEALLSAYFPTQPPLDGGADDVIHVLVRVERTRQATMATSQERISVFPTMAVEPPLPPQRIGWTARLVTSLRNAIVEMQRTTANGQARPTTLRPALVRCRGPHGCLWLPDNDDDERDNARCQTSVYIPSAWRELSAAIFQWVGAASTRRARFTGELCGRRALITGAPRGGKSVFLAFLLLQLLRLRAPPVCIVDVPGVAFARVDLQQGRVDEGAREADFRDELSDCDVVYLFDVSSAPSASTPLSARVVFARSILVRPHQRAPRTSKRTQSFVLPTWARADVQAGAERCFSRLHGPSVLALFDKWGGVPGRLFVRDPQRSERALETALARLSARTVVSALWSVARTSAWSSLPNESSADEWRALVVPTADGYDTTSRFAGGVAFTSQFVCDRALALAPLRTRELRGLLGATADALPVLVDQIRVSLTFLALEEEEKHADDASLMVGKPPLDAWGGRWE